MAHPEQMRFITFSKQIFPEYFQNKSVLEIGSLDINGSVREFFDASTYCGVDVASGKGVDLVAFGEDFPGKANEFDVVISCECFEHNPNFQKTWLNMIRVLRQDGLLLFTCASLGRRQHGTSLMDPKSSPLTESSSPDYYKNLSEKDLRFIELTTFFSRHMFLIDYSHMDLLFIGLGLQCSSEQIARFDSYAPQLEAFYQNIATAGIY